MHFNLDTYSDLPELKKIQILFKHIESLRPLDKDLENKIFQKFRLDWNYHSNAIEGNTLDYGETRAFLMHGLTAKGKPLKDHLDIQGHNKGIDFLMDLIQDSRPLSETDICNLHHLILVEDYESNAISPSGLPTKKTIKVGQYKQEPNHVKTVTGEIHYYATPQETPLLMRDLIEDYRSNIDKLPTAIMAAYLHFQIAHIHPFDDGNGRMARLVMNLVLMKAGFPPVVIQQDKASRSAYYAALSQADAGDFLPFLEIIIERLIHSLEIYLKGAKGESIDEPDDLDKKLALFRRKLEGREDKIEVKRTDESMQLVYEDFLGLIKEVRSVASKFNDFFFSIEEKYLVKEPDLSQYYLHYYPSDFGEKHEFFLSQQVALKKEIVLIRSFQLNEFKLATNPFSIELNLIIVFLEYHYEVYYTFSDKGILYNKHIETIVWDKSSPLLSRKYSEILSQDEVINSANKIGNKLFGIINDFVENDIDDLYENIQKEIKNTLDNDEVITKYKNPFDSITVKSYGNNSEIIVILDYYTEEKFEEFREVLSRRIKELIAKVLHESPYELCIILSISSEESNELPF